MYDKPLFLPAGDQAIVIELGNAIDPEITLRVHSLVTAIDKAQIPGVSEVVPTYRSLLVYYDPVIVSAVELQRNLEEQIGVLKHQTLGSARTVHIPTLYGGEYGPDLKFVAEHAKMTPEEVISVHSQTDYLVYMVGFSPGFAYLGGLDDRLITPRLETPRISVPAGSVGIAQAQTGIYPAPGPGGWQLIGRTPLRMFDSNRCPPTILEAGDYARFVPMEKEEEYTDLQRSVENGEYTLVTEGSV